MEKFDLQWMQCLRGGLVCANPLRIYCAASASTDERWFGLLDIYLTLGQPNQPVVADRV